MSRRKEGGERVDPGKGRILAGIESPARARIAKLRTEQQWIKKTMPPGVESVSEILDLENWEVVQSLRKLQKTRAVDHDIRTIQTETAAALDQVEGKIDALRISKVSPPVNGFYKNVLDNARRMSNPQLVTALEQQRDMPGEELYVATVPEPFAPFKAEPESAKKQDPLLVRVVAESALTLMDVPQQNPLLLTGSDTGIPSERLGRERYIEDRPFSPEIRKKLGLTKVNLRTLGDVYRLLGLASQAPKVADIRKVLTQFGGVEEHVHTLPSVYLPKAVPALTESDIKEKKFRKMINDFRQQEQPPEIGPVDLLQVKFTYAGDSSRGDLYVPPHVSLEVSKVKPVVESTPIPELNTLRSVTIYDPKDR